MVQIYVIELEKLSVCANVPCVVEVCHVATSFGKNNDIFCLQDKTVSLYVYVCVFILSTGAIHRQWNLFSQNNLTLN